MALAQIFTGCNVVFAGSFSKPIMFIHDDILAHGGKIQKEADGNTTHFVMYQYNYDKKPAKLVKALVYGNIHFVQIQWVNESIAAKMRLKEEKYALSVGLTASASAPKKRPAIAIGPVDTDSSEPPAKKYKDEQIVTNQALYVPVDNKCTLTCGPFAVFIDATGLVYDAELTKSELLKNCNKFFKMQVLYRQRPNKEFEFWTWTRQGRVGEIGQNSTYGNGSLPGAIEEFEAIFYEKSGLKWEERGDIPRKNKYVFIEKVYEQAKDGQELVTLSQLPEPTRNLMKLIFNRRLLFETLDALGYNSIQLPIGQLGSRHLDLAFQALQDLRAAIDKNARDKIQQVTDCYYSLIPHTVGRRTSLPLLDKQVLIDTELELLKALGNIQAADRMLDGDEVDEKGDKLDRLYEELGLHEMTPLSSDEAEYALIEQYLHNSRGETHDYQFEVVDIFRIMRAEEKDRQLDDMCVDDSRSNRRLLWHGSRCANFGGILSNGLQIAPPGAERSGKMFDDGIYLADASSKSAVYCHAYQTDDIGLLLLCEAELGNMNKLYKRDNSAATAIKNGYDSVWGHGKIGPVDWIDAGLIHDGLNGVKMPDISNPYVRIQDDDDRDLNYNEYIVYNTTQVRLRYLLRVHMPQEDDD